jgi:hypothetical protein
MIDKTAIWKKDPESGTVYLREGVTMAFFLPTPIAEVAGPILAAFEEYLKMIPAGVLRWASVGAGSEEWKPVEKKTIDRCRSQLKGEGTRKRSLTSFELADGDNGGDAPGFGIMVIGNPLDPDLPDEKSLLQMYFPSEVAAEEQAEDFVNNLRKLATLLPYVSGYASPGLHWAELHKAQALIEARAIARRHPGYDVQDNAIGRSDINLKVRGARWLTLLGMEIVEKIGGLKTLRQNLPGPIVVEEVGPGVMIRAGRQPEKGDVNRRIDTPLLRIVARVLEPVTAFGEIALLRTDFSDQDDNLLKQWERRFLD